MKRLFLILIISSLIKLSAFCHTGLVETVFQDDNDSIIRESSIAAPAPKVIPVPPKDLVVLETDFDYIYIVWGDYSDNETAFIIERHSEDDDYKDYDTVSADITYYLDYRVDPYTHYYYRVKAINQDGESATSNEVMGLTNSLPHSPPRKPSGLQGIFNVSNEIVLSWNDKSDNEDAFYIYRGETSNSIEFLDSIAANTSTYVDYLIESERTYHYYVAASNSFGVSEPSDTIELETEGISMLESPYLSIRKTSSNSVQLVWDSIPGHSVHYQLFRFSDNSDTVRFNPTTATEFNDPGLNSNTAYHYRILVSDDMANQVSSNTVEAKTLPGFVANRVSDSLIAMFILSQRDKESIPDFSWYGEPIELNISDTLKTEESGNGSLKINTPNALISLPEHNKKISEACKATQEISIECWLKTSSQINSEITTVLTFGNETSTAFSLNCQPSSTDIDKIVYSVNLSTRTTNQGGYPSFLSEEALVPNVLNHIVFSHDETGVERFYINGRLAAEGYRPSGFEEWLETYTLVLANDFNQQNPWLGELYMCSIYNTALEMEEISSNYTASPFTQDNYILNAVDYQLNLSPNPANAFVRLTISNPNNNLEITEKYFVRIVNLYGQVVDEIVVSNYLTGNPLEIETDYLPSGIYSVNLYNQHVLIDTQKLRITH